MPIPEIQTTACRTRHVLYSGAGVDVALEIFMPSLEPVFLLADYSLSYLALISFKEGNHDAAKQFLSQLRSRYPQSIWSQPAQLQQAKIDLAEKSTPRLTKLCALCGPKPALSQESSTKRFFFRRSHRKPWLIQVRHMDFIPN